MAETISVPPISAKRPSVCIVVCSARLASSRSARPRIDARHRLDRHRVRHRILQNQPAGHQQGRGDEPGLDRHDGGHASRRATSRYIMLRLHATSAAPSQTSAPFQRQMMSTRCPSGIFSAQGSPAQNASPARNAADSPRYSLTKNVPTMPVMVEIPQQDRPSAAAGSSSASAAPGRTARRVDPARKSAAPLLCAPVLRHGLSVTVKQSPDVRLGATRPPAKPQSGADAARRPP